MSENLSAFLCGINDIKLKNRDIPVPNEDQLLIKVHTVGLCGTDVHLWRKGAMGSVHVKEPLVLGHEPSGTVAGVGSKVKGFTVGDRVAVEPGNPCRTCDFCASGRYNLCHDMMCLGAPGTHGSLSRYIVQNADLCFKAKIGKSLLPAQLTTGVRKESKLLRSYHDMRRRADVPIYILRLPENVTFDEAAILEPLAVAVHACRRAKIQVGESVLVQGAGTIGTLCMMTAKSLGIDQIVITDLDQRKLDVAKTLGADHTVCTKNTSVEDVKRSVINCLKCAPDVTIECTGAQFCLESSILATRSGGRIVMVGVGNPRVEVPMVNCCLREMEIRGSFRFANDYPTALKLLASKKVDISKFTSAHYKLEEVTQAFERTQKGDVMKVFVQC